MQVRGWVLFLIITVVLGLAGGAYAAWASTLRLEGEVRTADVDAMWVLLEAQVKESVEVLDPETGEPVPQPIPPENDVADCLLDPEPGDVARTVRFQMVNAFPSYTCEITLAARITGTLPVQVSAVRLAATDADGDDVLGREVEVEARLVRRVPDDTAPSGFACDPGQPLDTGAPLSNGDGFCAIVRVHLTPESRMEHVYTAEVTLELAQWGIVPSEPVVTLVGLEVNQAVQDLEDSVPLVQDRATIVRAHLQSAAGDVPGVVVRLHGRRDGAPLPGSPLPMMNAGGTITATPDALARRGDLHSSANFYLPASWRSGTVELEVEGISHDLTCADRADALNDCMTTVTFLPAETPQVKWVGVRVSGAGSTPTTSQLLELHERLRAIYPVAGVDSALSSTTVGSGSTSLLAITSTLEAMRFWDGCWSNLGCQRLYYGVLSGLTGVGGMAAGIPGNVAVGLMPSLPFAFGRNRHAHELGHALGRHDAVDGALGPVVIDGQVYDKQGYCGEVASAEAPDFPYTATIGGATVFTIGPMAQGPHRLIYGLDTHTQRVADPRRHAEIMGYCGPDWRWTSDFTYNGLRAAINDRFGDGPDVVPGVPTTYLVVQGRIDLAGDSASFLPFYTLESAVVPPGNQSEQGRYTLRLLDASGRVLRRVAFEPTMYVSDAPAPGEGLPPRTGSFLVTVALDNTLPTSLAEVQVFRGGQRLARRKRSPSPPTVTVTFPNGGERLGDRATTIRWEASDPDGGSLRFIVQYSADCGQTYETLAVSDVGDSYRVPRGVLHGTRCGLVRVKASDGFNSAEDTSDAPFRAVNQGPLVNIAAPLNGALYLTGQVISLEGSALDPEDGALAGESLAWELEATGQRLGTGPALDVPASALGEGTHTILLKATDSNRLTRFTSVVVRVLEALPPDAAPPACSTQAQGDTVTITVQDADSGLLRVDVADSANAVVDVPLFGPGTAFPVGVSAARAGPGQEASIALEVTDVAGNSAICEARW